MPLLPGKDALGLGSGWEACGQAAHGDWVPGSYHPRAALSSDALELVDQYPSFLPHTGSQRSPLAHSSNLKDNTILTGSLALPSPTSHSASWIQLSTLSCVFVSVLSVLKCTHVLNG